MYQYRAKLIKVVDGDTVDAMIDQDWCMDQKRIRLGGIDAWGKAELEIRKRKQKGLKAKEYLKATT